MRGGGGPYGWIATWTTIIAVGICLALIVLDLLGVIHGTR
jgi:hypothetical protein